MQAIIDPRVTDISHISSWDINPLYPDKSKNKYVPVYETYPNSARVCEVMPNDQVFPVAEPLYWYECPDNCVADQWVFDTVSHVFTQITNAVRPLDDQPITSGTTTL